MYENELKLLWKTTFKDEEKYINRFFEKVYSPDNTLVERMDGQVVSMLYMVPYELEINNIVYPAMYLYALATAEPYRGRNIMSGLIDKAHEIADKKGYLCSFLIPERETLFDFYRKFGYEIPFYEDRIFIRQDMPGQNISIIETDKSTEELWEMQKALYEKKNKKIMLQKEQFLFYLEDFYHEGGKVYSVVEEDRVLGHVYGMYNGKNIVVYDTDIENYILESKEINVSLEHRIRGMIRPSNRCRETGIDLNEMYVRKVLC